MNDNSHTNTPITMGVEFLDCGDVTRTFGIRRTSLYFLLKTGKIKSVLLRRPGNLTGRRLIHVESVRRYLMEEMEKQSEFTPALCNAHTHAEKGEQRGVGTSGCAAASSSQDGQPGGAP